MGRFFYGWERWREGLGEVGIVVKSSGIVVKMEGIVAIMSLIVALFSASDSLSQKLGGL